MLQNLTLYRKATATVDPNFQDINKEGLAAQAFV
jgi:hypothetical protein